MPRTPSTTAEAISQRKPFRDVRHEGAVALLLTADVIRRKFADFLAGPGKDQVTAQQFNVLRILRGAGPEGLPTLTIAERMIEKTPGITGMIDRLAEKGLVEREHCPVDRRRVFCRITKAGTDLLAGLDAPVDALRDELLGCLTQGEVRDLVALLDRVRNHNH